MIIIGMSIIYAIYFYLYLSGTYLYYLLPSVKYLICIYICIYFIFYIYTQLLHFVRMHLPNHSKRNNRYT